MIIVIADDLTGAAEIAGLGCHYGIDTALLMQVPEVLPQRSLVVMVADTRSAQPEQAVTEVEKLCAQLQTLCRTMDPKPILYKKVDSFVRGHVVEELQAVLRSTDYQQAIYMPANPSLGQIIRGGCYYCNDVPLDQTPYVLTDCLPIRSASVCLHLGITPQSRIRVPDAVTYDDVAQVVNQAMQSETPTLLAGSLDLFTGLLEYLGHQPNNEERFTGLSRDGSALIVCGSPHSTDIQSRPFVRRRDLPLDSMPRDVYDGSQGASYWLANIQVRHFSRAAIQPARYGLVLNIPYERSCSSDQALRLRTEMAEVVGRLVEQMQPAELIIEGGATAYAAFLRLGWKHFSIRQLISPGVVRMQCDEQPSVAITFKPGSYPWGEVLFDWQTL